MARVRPALTAAAVAAALATAPMVAGIGATAAQWHDSGTIEATTLRTGNLEITSVNSGFTPNYKYEVDGGKSVIWEATVTGDLQGVDSAVLNLNYAWGKRSSSWLWSWSSLTSFIDTNTAVTRAASGNINSDAGVNGSILLVRSDDVASPPGTSGYPRLVVGDGAFTVKPRLRMYNSTSGTVFGGTFALENGTLTATLTQVLRTGVATPWTSSGSAALSTVQNTDAFSSRSAQLPGDVSSSPTASPAPVDGQPVSPPPADSDTTPGEPEAPAPVDPSEDVTTPPADDPGAGEPTPVEPPESPEPPEAPETPQEPEQPAAPEQPEQPETPQEPEQPEAQDAPELQISNLPSLPTLDYAASAPEDREPVDVEQVEQVDVEEQVIVPDPEDDVLPEDGHPDEDES